MRFEIGLGPYDLRFENVPDKPDREKVARVLEALAAGIRLRGIARTMQQMQKEGPHRMEDLEALDANRITVVIR